MTANRGDVIVEKTKLKHGFGWTARETEAGS